MWGGSTSWENIGHRAESGQPLWVATGPWGLASGHLLKWVQSELNRLDVMSDIKNIVTRDRKLSNGRWGLRLVHPTRASSGLEFCENREPKALFILGLYINSVWPTCGSLSWYFDTLDILVSLSKHLPLIFFINSPSLWDWEYFQVHLHEWLHLVVLVDRCGCGVLVTLGGCCHLDSWEQRWRSGMCC